MTRTPLMFGFASKLDGGVQLGPDVLCQFSGFEMGGFVLSPVCKHGARFGHKMILSCLAYENPPLYGSRCAVTATPDSRPEYLFQICEGAIFSSATTWGSAIVLSF